MLGIRIYKEMIIQLKPEHLGELTFKVSVEKGIVVRVSILIILKFAEVPNFESSLAQA